MEWINVNDRLPEIDNDSSYMGISVLVSTKRNEVTIGMYYFDSKDWEVTNGEYWSCEEVTHWMPLPEKP